ncbi:MAG: hypothetical protein ACPGYV_13785 [Phycisphaeraceae bacterium]
MGAQDVKPLSMRRSMVGFVKETTAGTAVTVSAMMVGTTVYNAKFRPSNFFADGERVADGISHGQFAKSSGMRKGTGTFSTEVRHGDQTMALLELAGYVLSTDNGPPVEVTLTPSSSFSAHSTATFRNWEDGGYQEIYGAVVTGARLRPLTPGGRLMWEWTIEGVWGGDGTQALPTMEDVDSPAPAMRASGITLTLGGGALPQVSTFELDLGLQGEDRESLTATNALEHMLVGDRRPSLTLDPETRLIADYDGIGKYESGLPEALAMSFADPTGNTFALTAAAAQRDELERTNRGNKRIDQLRMNLCITEAGDDDLVFVRTDAP